MKPFESPETQALLACLSSQPTRVLAHHPIEAPIDWSNFFAQADGLGVNGLVYCSLKELGFGSVIPQADLELSKNKFYFNQVKNMKLYARLKEVLQAFAQTGIEVIVLKGGALAELTYPKM